MLLSPVVAGLTTINTVICPVPEKLYEVDAPALILIPWVFVVHVTAFNPFTLANE
jgi:hypothetical protein